jgi:hypothetical protein
MNKTYKLYQSGLPLVPDNTYSAELTGYEKLSGENFKYGPAIRLKFEINEGVHKGTKLDLMCPDKFTPNSKLFKTLKNIVGDKVWNKELNLRMLIGTSCEITTHTVVGDKGDFSRVKEVSPTN